MSMEKPEALLLLLGLIPLGFVFFGGLMQARRSVRVLEGFGLAQVHSRSIFLRWLASAVLFALFYCSAILVLCGVSWGQQSVEEDRRNLDLVVVVDISRSMLATDSSPSRLGRSVAVVHEVLAGLPQARVAVVAYKGRAVPLVPLTADHNAIKNAIGSLSPFMTTATGSRPEAGLETALSMFAKSSNRHRMVLLLSDGEGIGNAASALARRAGADGIPIICVGLGTEAGTQIDLANGQFILDSQGVPAVSRLDSGALRNISQPSGGAFLPDYAGPAFLASVVSELHSRIDESDTRGFRVSGVDRRSTFIVVAVCALGLFVWFRTVQGRIKT